MYKSDRFPRFRKFLCWSRSPLFSFLLFFFCSHSRSFHRLLLLFFFLLRLESVSVSAVTFMLFFFVLPCWTAVWQRRRLSGQHRLFWRLWLSFKNNNPYFCCCIFISVMSLKARHSVSPPLIPQRSLVNQSNMFSSETSLFRFWLYRVCFSYHDKRVRPSAADCIHCIFLMFISLFILCNSTLQYFVVKRDVWSRDSLKCWPSPVKDAFIESSWNSCEELW